MEENDGNKKEKNNKDKNTLIIVLVVLFVLIYSYVIYNKFYISHETPSQKVENEYYYENIDDLSIDDTKEYILKTKLDIYEELDNALESFIDYNESIQVGYLNRDYSFNRFYKIIAGKNIYKIELNFSGHDGQGCITKIGYLSDLYKIKVNGVYVSFEHGGGRGSSFEIFDNRYLLMNDHSIGDVGSYVTVFDEDMNTLYNFVSDGMYGELSDSNDLYILENNEITYYCTKKEFDEYYKFVVYKVVTSYSDGKFDFSRMIKTDYETKDGKGFTCIY